MVAYTYNLSTFKGRGGQITRSGDQDQPGQQSEIPSLQKIQKLARHGGTHLWSQLLRGLWWKDYLDPEVEAAVSQDHPTVL